MNRRHFLKDIGLFTILAGAGRVWKVERKVISNPAFGEAEYALWLMYNKAAFEAVRLHDSDLLRTTNPFDRLLTEEVFIINQGLVTRSIENPHSIPQVLADRQGEQQRTVLGSAVDPIHPPNDRPTS